MKNADVTTANKKKKKSHIRLNMYYLWNNKFKKKKLKKSINYFLSPSQQLFSRLTNKKQVNKKRTDHSKHRSNFEINFCKPICFLSLYPNRKVLPSVTRTIGFLAKLLRCPFPNLEATKQFFILRNTLKTRFRPQKETRKKNRV